MDAIVLNDLVIEGCNRSDLEPILRLYITTKYPNAALTLQETKALSKYLTEYLLEQMNKGELNV